jgi:replicative DNA helicase
MSEAKDPVVPMTGRLKSIRNEGDFSPSITGKIQPQAVPLEEAVLGALMIDKDAIAIVLDILKPDSFYMTQHQIIYRAMLKLFERSTPVDLLTVNEELKKSQELDAAGGTAYLVELTNRVGSAANLEYHAKIVAQKHIQRDLIRVSTQTINNAFEDTMDVFDMLDEAERGLFEITQQNLNRGFESLGALATKAQKQLEMLSQKETGLTGIPSGFEDLDKITSGWQPSDLIIIAARPGMGKTAFTLSLAKNAAMDYKKPVAIFSLEMASVQLVQRMISSEAEVEGNKLRNGKLANHEWQQIHTAIEKMADVPIFIDDTPGINIFELRAKCRRLKQQHDIQLIVIDYLQLMTGGGENKKSGTREQEISSISRSLKGLAKELNVPVIALSQLSRAVETRGASQSKRPQLSDLRESGAIEQDADIVTFIYRPEYYEIMEDENGVSMKGMAEIIIAKHRNGALGTVRLRFVGDYAKFENPIDQTFASLDENDFLNPFGSGIITRSSRINEDDSEPDF